MKVCKKCFLDLNEDQFNLDKSRVDQLTIYCKTCLKKIRELNKTRYDFGKDYYKAVNNNRKEYHKNYYRNKKNET
jgi:hypothetical protein